MMHVFGIFKANDLDEKLSGCQIQLRHIDLDRWKIQYIELAPMTICTFTCLLLKMALLPKKESIKS
jgi:hypothetical protein